MKRVGGDVLEAARAVRAKLLARGNIDRDLGGFCGLASMMLAEALADADVFRVGFFMRWEVFCGKRGRYPHPHAWCQVGESIVDVTATQFGRFPAVHVVAAHDTDRYIERANGIQGVDNIMESWRCNQEPEYRKLRRRLRALDDNGANR